ncbi:thioredoxin-like [Discoglossus pictus]
MIVVQTKAELNLALFEHRDKLTLVYFSSGKCGPCRLITPFLEEKTPQMPDVACIKIDVNDSEDFVEHFKITGIPAFIFFRNGNQVYCFQGGNRDHLETMLNKLRNCD